MAREFPVRIYSADEIFYEGPSVSLIVPTRNGMLGILAGASNLVASVVPGVLHCRTPEGEDRVASVANGIVKIEGGEVLVLVETLEYQRDIDVERAEETARSAREKLEEHVDTHQAYLQAEAELARALARLRAVGRVK